MQENSRLTFLETNSCSFSSIVKSLKPELAIAISILDLKQEHGYKATKVCALDRFWYAPDCLNSFVSECAEVMFEIRRYLQSFFVHFFSKLRDQFLTGKQAWKIGQIVNYSQKNWIGACYYPNL